MMLRNAFLLSEALALIALAAACAERQGPRFSIAVDPGLQGQPHRQLVRRLELSFQSAGGAETVVAKTEVQGLEVGQSLDIESTDESTDPRDAVQWTVRALDDRGEPVLIGGAPASDSGKNIDIVLRNALPQ